MRLSISSCISLFVAPILKERSAWYLLTSSPLLNIIIVGKTTNLYFFWYDGFLATSIYLTLQSLNFPTHVTLLTLFHVALKWITLT